MVEALKSRPYRNTIHPDDSFGTWLRRQREVREIGLREIAESTKISIRYLEALEKDRFDVLPAPVFAKGFLREYARFVGLDDEEVVNYYLASQSDAPVEEEEASTKGATTPSPPYALYLGLAVVLLFAIVGGVRWWLVRDVGDIGPVAPDVAEQSTVPEAASETATAPDGSSSQVATTDVAPIRVTL